MYELYHEIAQSLKRPGLPASTYIVERYLQKNDFDGLMRRLAAAAGTECRLEGRERRFADWLERPAAVNS